MHRHLKTSLRWLWRAALLGIVLALLVTGLNLWMTLRAGGRIVTEASQVPETDVALVLGTGKIFDGGINRHFTVRMNAAASLYKAGRVRHFLLSGDNGRNGYNEPEDMKAALVERGVPAAAMSCDYAGFRTLDSVIRAKEIFGLKRCVIISDDFHLARALWLADRNGIEATAFYTEIVPWGGSWKSRCREWLARVKAVADEVTGTQPKFGGERITLPIDHGDRGTASHSVPAVPR